MLTHVTDHLINKPIPVEYIEPGAETLAQEYDGLHCAALMADACQCEIIAMEEGRIDAVNPVPQEMLPLTEDQASRWVYDLENNALDRYTWICEVAQGFALAITEERQLTLADSAAA